METAGTVLLVLGFILIVAAIYVGVFWRSFKRNAVLGRTAAGCVVFALFAAWFWPVTILWWLFGATPERRARGRY